MSTTLTGRPGAPGVALAAAWIYRPGRATGGVARSLDEAVAAAEAELQALAAALRAGGRGSEAEILEAQALMARDPALLDTAQDRMRGGAPADAAIAAAGEEAAEMLAAIDDPLLAARAADVRDVAARITRAVRGEAPPRLPRRSIVVARDLPPSVTAELDPALLAGIALEGGAPTAHAAILARALGIPAVVGIDGLFARAENAGVIGIDGDSAEVWIDPDAATADELRRRGERQRAHAVADRALRDAPLATRDGHRIGLVANIGQPAEEERALEAGADGIGLFRTEFIFMGRSRPPSIETQAEAYAAVLGAFPGDGVVVLRLADIGGDKGLPYLALPQEQNPFLGVRAIRLAQTHRGLLVDQLRAILRAGRMAQRRPAIMAPMVADAGDATLLHELIDEAMKLEAGDGVPQRPRVGIMVELPSAALLAGELARGLDFFSIGTNDLTQYLLAADRTNAALADRQDPLHPAVLRAIALTVTGAHDAGIPVAVCGEMAGDPAGALLLVGLGVDELSTDAGRFAGLKRAMREVTLGELQELAAESSALPSAALVRERAAPLVGRALTAETAS
ncbi:MAG: phosphoenolpyruvate--protein phosphotransferase [Chloroflexota bacterium]